MDDKTARGPRRRSGAMTPEKREEWLQQQKLREDRARSALADGVARLADRQGWRTWLRFSARFPKYSFANQLLVASQLPTASLVMAASEWRQVGRYPAAGSTALRIWAPRRVPKVQPDEKQGEQQGEQDRMRFVLVPVFDVSQTAGESLPEQPAPVPPPAGLAPAGMWEALSAFAADRGYAVSLAPTGGPDGLTDTARRSIVVDPGASDLAQTLTLAHEIGHMALHADAEGSAHRRGILEIEAESVAFAVAAAYGIEDASEWHFDYLANWAAALPGGQDAAAAALKAVHGTAERVLGVTRPLLEHLHEAGVGHAAPDRVPVPPPPHVTVASTR